MGNETDGSRDGCSLPFTIPTDLIFTGGEAQSVPSKPDIVGATRDGERPWTKV